MQKENVLNHGNCVFKKTKWSQEEDNLLRESIAKNGTSNWTVVASVLSATCRSGKQCRERWMNQLDPNLNKESWKTVDDILLFTKHSCFGNSWVTIAKFFPGRSPNSIKNRWSWLTRHHFNPLNLSSLNLNSFLTGQQQQIQNVPQISPFQNNSQNICEKSIELKRDDAFVNNILTKISEDRKLFEIDSEKSEVKENEKNEKNINDEEESEIESPCQLHQFHEQIDDSSFDEKSSIIDNNDFLLQDKSSLNESRKFVLPSFESKHNFSNNNNFYLPSIDLMDLNVVPNMTTMMNTGSFLTKLDSFDFRDHEFVIAEDFPAMNLGENTMPDILTFCDKYQF